jgi:deazaflavin-dependent oxidoreductase (nitroreductase family)
LRKLITVTELQVKPYTQKQEKFGKFFVKKLGKLQVWLYRASGGRLANKFLHDAPVALLTTVGRKSGKARISPLLFLERDDTVIVVATQGGFSSYPLWYLNMVATPAVEIQIGKRKRAMLSRHGTDQEQQALWPELDAMYPDFVEYRQRIGDRRSIPVMILEPRV